MLRVQLNTAAMLTSLVVQKLYHDKYVLSPDGKVLGQTPGKDQPTNDRSTEVKEREVPPPPKAALNPVVIIAGMFAFVGITIGAMYLDTKVNYLFYLLSGSFIFIILLIFSDKHLTKEEKQRIWVLVIIAFFVVFFWGAYEQTGASLVFFADRQTNLNLWGDYFMPVSYFQSFNSAFIIIFAPIFAWLWL